MMSLIKNTWLTSLASFLRRIVSLLRSIGVLTITLHSSNTSRSPTLVSPFLSVATLGNKAFWLSTPIF